MTTKTLENYFDDWVNVHTTSDDMDEKIEWARRNVGMRGLEWDGYLIPSKLKQGTLRFSMASFKFKSKDNAFLFVLTFGGEIINHGDTNERRK